MTTPSDCAVIDDSRRGLKHRLMRFVCKTLLNQRPCEFVGIAFRSELDAAKCQVVTYASCRWEVAWWATEDDVRRRLRHADHYFYAGLRAVLPNLKRKEVFGKIDHNRTKDGKRIIPSLSIRNPNGD